MSYLHIDDIVSKSYCVPGSRRDHPVVPSTFLDFDSLSFSIAIKSKETIKRFVVKINPLSIYLLVGFFFFFDNLFFSDAISYLNIRYQNFEIDSFVSKEYFQFGDKIWSDDYVGCSRINDYKNNSQ